MEIPTNISLELSWMYKVFRVLKVTRTLYTVLKSRETSGEWLVEPTQPDSEDRMRWRDVPCSLPSPTQPQTSTMPAYTPHWSSSPLAVNESCHIPGCYLRLFHCCLFLEEEPAGTHDSLLFALLSGCLLSFAPLYLMPRSKLWQTRSFWKELWSFMLPRPLAN